jgi:hypothetical protein
VKEQICLDFLAVDSELKNTKKIVQELRYGEILTSLIAMQ